MLPRVAQQLLSELLLFACLNTNKNVAKKIKYKNKTHKKISHQKQSTNKRAHAFNQ